MFKQKNLFDSMIIDGAHPHLNDCLKIAQKYDHKELIEFLINKSVSDR